MPLKLAHPSVWLGLAAVLSGVLAFYGAQRYLSNSSAEVKRSFQERYAPRDVLVASRDLEPGRPIIAADIAKRSMPSAFVPGGALSPEQLQEVLGKPLVLPLRAGDPIVDSFVATRNEAALAARLREGARAVTVPVDEVSSQAGLVRPGDRVDLMLAEELEEGSARCIRVKPLLESLSVLATGRVQADTSQGADAMLRRGVDVSSYSTITLDVSPEQAQQLALALRVGELIPLLRGDDDQSPLRLAERLDGRPGCAQSPSRETGPTPSNGRRGRRIEIIVGGESSAQRSELWVPSITARRSPVRQ